MIATHDMTRSTNRSQPHRICPHHLPCNHAAPSAKRVRHAIGEDLAVTVAKQVCAVRRFDLACVSVTNIQSTFTRLQQAKAFAGNDLLVATLYSISTPSGEEAHELFTYQFIARARFVRHAVAPRGHMEACIESLRSCPEWLGPT